ncbi:unnamed protein product, partial [Brassica oleracea]
KNSREKEYRFGKQEISVICVWERKRVTTSINGCSNFYKSQEKVRVTEVERWQRRKSMNRDPVEGFNGSGGQK